MYFTHADAVWDGHGGLRAAVLAVDGVRCMTTDPERQAGLLARIEARLAAGPEAGMAEIAAWREAFSRMGLKPTQYRCAAEALLRRFRKERSMPRFHPLVDWLNHVSMAHAIPIAAFDIARIAGGLTVRPAAGDERYETFAGEVETPAPGEIVFADDRGNAHARRWTHRQSALSVVRPETDRVLIVAEAQHGAAADDVAALAREIDAGLAATGVQVTAAMRLAPDARRFEF